MAWVQLGQRVRMVVRVSLVNASYKLHTAHVMDVVTTYIYSYHSIAQGVRKACSSLLGINRCYFNLLGIIGIM